MLLKNHHYQAWTFLECLILLAILSIVSVLAMPNYNALTDRIALQVTSSTLLRCLHTARVIAIQKQSEVTVCAAGINNQCGSLWQNGVMLKWQERDEPKMLQKSLRFSQIQVDWLPGLARWPMFDMKGQAVHHGQFLLRARRGRQSVVHLNEPWRIIISRTGRARLSRSR